MNTDHLAVSETDYSGNWLRSLTVPLVTYGKSQKQAEALIGDAVAEVVALARAAGKPLVIENLDFSKKKDQLEGEYPGRSRMLSSFAYGKIRTYFLSRGYREGVEVVEVNPAFSSLMGRVLFMERYGLSVDQAAALVLARRLLNCSEGIPDHGLCPDGYGGHVAFRAPAPEEAREARMDAVGNALGPVETGSCRAASARRAGKYRYASSGPGWSSGREWSWL